MSWLRTLRELPAPQNARVCASVYECSRCVCINLSVCLSSLFVPELLQAELYLWSVCLVSVISHAGSSPLSSLQDIYTWKHTAL